MKEEIHTTVSRIHSPSNDRVGRVLIAVQEAREIKMEKAKNNSIVIEKEKEKILPNFVIKVFDVIDSKEGVYDINIKDFFKLRSELMKEFSPDIRNYYKPNSLQWWCTHLKLFLVIYVKPNLDFSVLVDKKAIRNFVKNKMKHHSWLKQSASMVSSNDEYDKRGRNFLSANASRANIAWSKLEEMYYSIPLSEKQGKYWNELKSLFSYESHVLNGESEIDSDFNYFDVFFFC